MKNSSLQPRTITVAQRGQIIQCIIVDGWTSVKASATFDVPEHIIDLWVADYRRYGMASLRHEPGKTFAGEFLRSIFSRLVRAVVRGVTSGLRNCFAHDRRTRPLPLRRYNDDRRGGS